MGKSRRQPPSFALTCPPGTVGPVPGAAASDAAAPTPGLRGASRKLVGRIAADVPQADLIHDWPAQVLALAEAAEAALRAAPAGADPHTLALAIVAAQGAAMRGARVAFPRPERMARILRDARIWREFDGRNLAALAARYKMSKPGICGVLQHQRELRRRRLGVKKERGARGE